MPLFYLAERVSSVVDEKLDVEKSERKSEVEIYRPHGLEALLTGLHAY